MNAITKIEFHDATILAVETDGDYLILMKSMCGGIRIAWNGQFEKIKRDPILSKGFRVTRIPSGGGMQDAVCLPLRLVPMWLAKLDASRIKNPEAQARILLWQEEATEVLFRHFYGKAAPRPASVAPVLRAPGSILARQLPQATERVINDRIRLAGQTWGPAAMQRAWVREGLVIEPEFMDGTAQARSGRTVLRALLAFRPGTGKLSVGDILLEARTSATAAHGLGACGMLIEPDGYDGHLVVADVHPVLSMALRAERYHKHDWRRALLALEGAMPTPKFKFGNVRATGVAVPLADAFAVAEEREAA